MGEGKPGGVGRDGGPARLGVEGGHLGEAAPAPPLGVAHRTGIGIGVGEAMPVHRPGRTGGHAVRLVEDGHHVVGVLDVLVGINGGAALRVDLGRGIGERRIGDGAGGADAVGHPGEQVGGRGIGLARHAIGRAEEGLGQPFVTLVQQL